MVFIAAAADDRLTKLKNWSPRKKFFFNVHIISTERIWSSALFDGVITSYFLLPTVHPLMHQVLVDYFSLLSSDSSTHSHFL